jgi:excisionase family DNA binding protein
MEFITRLPDNINVTVSKKDLLELFNICLIKSRHEQVKYFPEFLSIKQLSEYINYSEPAIYKMVAQREIPCYKIAGKLLFKKVEIDEWLLEFRQPTITEKVDELLRKEAKYER